MVYNGSSTEKFINLRWFVLISANSIHPSCADNRVWEWRRLWRIMVVWTLKQFYCGIIIGSFWSDFSHSLMTLIYNKKCHLLNGSFCLVQKWGLSWICLVQIKRPIMGEHIEINHELLFGTDAISLSLSEGDGALYFGVFCQWFY